MRTHILVADDHPAVRRGLRLMLDAEQSVADRDLVRACRAAMRGKPFVYSSAVRAVIRDYFERARADDPASSHPRRRQRPEQR